jgi:hypothetical protein
VAVFADTSTQALKRIQLSSDREGVPFVPNFKPPSSKAQTNPKIATGGSGLRLRSNPANSHFLYSQITTSARLAPYHRGMGIGRRLRYVIITAVGVLGILLLTARTPVNPPIDRSRTLESRLNVPADVASTLQRSCYDCHSNATRWPWYGSLAPGYWVLSGDVNGARRMMNFSDWPASSGEPAERAAGLLMAACAAMKSGLMPRPSYLLLHPDAKVSNQEAERFCAWSLPEATRLMSSSRPGAASRAANQ